MRYILDKGTFFPVTNFCQLKCCILYEAPATVPPLKCTLIMALVSHLKYREVCFVPAKNIGIHFYMTLTFMSDLYYILIVNRNKQVFAFIELRQGGNKIFKM